MACPPRGEVRQHDPHAESDRGTIGPHPDRGAEFVNHAGGGNRELQSQRRTSCGIQNDPLAGMATVRRVTCDGMGGHTRAAVRFGERPTGPPTLKSLLDVGGRGSGRLQEKHAAPDRQQGVTGWRRRQRRRTGHGFSTATVPWAAAALRERVCTNRSIRGSRAIPLSLSRRRSRSCRHSRDRHACFSVSAGGSAAPSDNGANFWPSEAGRSRQPAEHSVIMTQGCPRPASVARMDRPKRPV